MEISLIRDVRHAFRNSEEYNSIYLNYKIAISQLQTNENIYKIFVFENLLRDKNIVEILYSLQKGYSRDIIPDGADLFEKGVEETINLKNLFSEISYRTLHEKINEKKTEILTVFKNQNYAIEKLLETYSTVNYELIKTAYIIGYNAQKNNKALQCLTKMNPST